MTERHACACGGGTEDGLGVLPGGGAGGAVATVADGHVALHGAEGLLVEHLRDEPQVFEHQDLRAVGHGDARSLLASVLQGIQAVIGELCDILTGCPDTEHATFFAWLVLRLVGV